MRKHMVLTGIAMLITMGLLAAPVAAHNLEIAPHGTDEVITGWVGGGALPDPAQGQGLIPGGHAGQFLQSPAHGSGLVTACEAVETTPSVVDIRGPGGPGCPHGQ